MWDSFTAWGASYGLWVSVFILIFIIIVDNVENTNLKRAIQREREEKRTLEEYYNMVLCGEKYEPSNPDIRRTGDNN